LAETRRRALQWTIRIVTIRIVIVYARAAFGGRGIPLLEPQFPT